MSALQNGLSFSCHLWESDQILREVSVETPLLASWESKTHPAQVRLQKHLTELRQMLGDLDEFGPDLGLEYSVDVGDPARLVRHYDLENYLTPVVSSLGAEKFRYVKGIKFVGGGSFLRIYSTKARESEWNPDRFKLSTRMSGSVQSKQWKIKLREAIKQSGAIELEPGAVGVEMLWRASPKRNWVSLWKPTGDAMGPILGESVGKNPFNPQDDRITSLGLHLNHDVDLGFDVDIALWWERLIEQPSIEE